MAESNKKPALPAVFEEIAIGESASRFSRAIFFLLCLIVVFSTVVFGGVDQVSWVILTIFAAVIALSWFADAWFGRAFLVNRDVILIPVLALIVIGLIQIIPLFPTTLPDGLIAEPGPAAISLDPYATRLFVARLAVYFVFFAAALTFINTEIRLRRIVTLIIVFGALMAFFGILQRLANPEAIYGLRAPSQAIPFGPFVNQHHFAAFMVMTAGVTFGLLFGSGVGRDKRLLLSLGAILMGIAVMMTGSRGGLISFVGTLVFVAVGSHFAARNQIDGSGFGPGRRRKFALIVGVTALMILIFGAVIYLGADSTIVRGLGLAGADDYSSGRKHFWAIALKIFFAHPILGAGFDAFGVAFTRYDTWPGVFRVEQAHNDYLQTLADAGVAGFIAIASFIYLLFRKGFNRVAVASDSYLRCASLGALAGCFGILIHSFFDFPLRTPSNLFVFLILAVITVTAIKPKSA